MAAESILAPLFGLCLTGRLGPALRADASLARWLWGEAEEKEIGEAAWLPLADYFESTKAMSARQGLEENFNAFVVGHVYGHAAH